MTEIRRLCSSCYGAEHSSCAGCACPCQPAGAEHPAAGLSAVAAAADWDRVHQRHPLDIGRGPCSACGHPWPCEVRQLLDALAAAEADVALLRGSWGCSCHEPPQEASVCFTTMFDVERELQELRDKPNA